jgi:hypothetical protein
MLLLAALTYCHTSPAPAGVTVAYLHIAKFTEHLPGTKFELCFACCVVFTAGDVRGAEKAAELCSSVDEDSII